MKFFLVFFGSGCISLVMVDAADSLGAIGVLGRMLRYSGIDVFFRAKKTWLIGFSWLLNFIRAIKRIDLLGWVQKKVDGQMLTNFMFSKLKIMCFFSGAGFFGSLDYSFELKGVRVKIGSFGVVGVFFKTW